MDKITINISPMVILRVTIRVKPIYALVDLSKTLLKILKNIPNGPRYGFCFLSKSEHRAGLRVNALTDENTTETATVMANCLYRLPVIPPMAATGINTATRTSVVAIMGAVTSLIACTVASLGSIPFSILTWTASTTTMASSTTIPMAKTRPRRDNTLMVKPINGNRINAPIRETGMAMVGISAALQSWIKIKTTKITSARAINRVSMISSMPAVMARVVSRDTSYLKLSGKDPESSSIVFLTFSASSTALEPGA